MSKMTKKERRRQIFALVMAGMMVVGILTTMLYYLIY